MSEARVRELEAALAHLSQIVGRVNLLNLDHDIGLELMKAQSLAKEALGGEQAKRSHIARLRREADRLECEMRGTTVPEMLREKADAHHHAFHQAVERRAKEIAS